MKAAKELKLSFWILGCGGGKAQNIVIVPSNETGRIQEAHITAGHALMEYIEDDLLASGHLSLQNKDEAFSENIDAFVFDFDGVMTNNQVFIDQNGREV